MIGLCTTRNDRAFRWAIRAAVPHLERLYILDGSTGWDVKRYVKFIPIPTVYMRQKWVKGTVITHGIRQQIWEVIKEREAPGEWVYLLHTDEIPHDNPTAVRIHAENHSADAVIWSIIDFFYHTNQAKLLFDRKWFVQNGPLIDKAQNFDMFYWYRLPAIRRVRMFRLDPSADYPPDSLVEYPSPLSIKTIDSKAIMRHYPFMGNLYDICTRLLETVMGRRFKNLRYSYLLLAPISFDTRWVYPFFNKFQDLPGAPKSSIYNEKNKRLKITFG